YAKGFSRLLKCDFMYLYYPNSFSPLAFLASTFGKKYGLYVRGEVGVTTKRSIWLYKHAQIILTVADKFTDQINVVLGSQFAKTIRPMISFSKDDIVVRKNYNKLSGFKLLYLGRIDPAKGLKELLDAVKILKES